MKRYFYVSNDLNDLETVEKALEEAGISRGQIHVLSEDEAGVERRDLNQVYSWFKTDVINTTYKGVLVGLVLAILTLVLGNSLGGVEAIGWAPFIMLAIVFLGFCTWEGGLIGSHLPSSRFRRFKEVLERGEHVLMVDAREADVDTINSVVEKHPGMNAAGEDTAHDAWTVIAEKRFRQFISWGP